MSEERPNPDALLAQANEEESASIPRRGRLKIFFGAVAGVGKTYAMLEEARARAAEGLDVVVGYAEPHARMETEALLLGMQILPYQVVEYKGARLKEFDLDAALKRRPALLILDELAHTNAPGLRHAKRWQDVMELLDAGIDVYTTLNVQHLESVVDIVQRITGVVVRETLPDVILEKADEVELIDISPEELLERLAEGKIYRADEAQRASKYFFNKGNLYALREMALRRTADRVDAQMLAFRKGRGIREPWAASERILVCVGPSPLSSRLVRATKRLAAGLKANWVAAHVETPTLAQRPQVDRDRVAQHLRLAEQLGAQTVSLAGASVAQELLNYAKSHNITKIVIGRPEQRGWRHLFRKSVVDELVDASGPIDIYVVRGEPEEQSKPPAPVPKRVVWSGYIWSASIVVLTTCLGWLFFHGLGRPRTEPVDHWLSNTNVLMLYLLGVVWIATRHGRGPAILASLLGVAAFDFCFVPPYLTFAVADSQYIVTFSVMLVTAVVLSTLADRVRRQAQFARHRERRTAALFDLSRQIAASPNVEGIIEAALKQVGAVFEADVAILLPQQANLMVRSQRGAAFANDPKELAVAQWVFDHNQLAGAGTGTLPAAQGLYLPLAASRSTLGVLGIRPSSSSNLSDLEQLRLLESFANQAASAIERAKLAEEARHAWERVEAEFMRNTLLSSVSHDLRTPLAAITGAASSLVDGRALDESTRSLLAQSIVEESERMERVISNLLDMTRLESGGLMIHKEWQPIHEVVGAALHHLSKRLGNRPIKTNLPDNLPMVPIDAVAMEQVLINLLDNAAEYTPPTSPIEVWAREHAGQLVVEVADHGPGLPTGTESRVFQKFFRADATHGRRGIGLGLAICKGLVEAHGGTIKAANRAEGGAVFTFTLPIEGAPPALRLTETATPVTTPA
jgi:two-component system sensor histidine kinase KdpD